MEICGFGENEEGNEINRSKREPKVSKLKRKLVLFVVDARKNVFFNRGKAFAVVFTEFCLRKSANIQDKQRAIG